MRNTRFTALPYTSAVAAVLVAFASPLYADIGTDRNFYDTPDDTVTSFAQTKEAPITSFESEPNDNGFYLGGSAGATFTEIGEDQSVTHYDSLGTPWKYDFTDTDGSNTKFLVGINGGYEFALKNNWLLDLGVGIYKPFGDYEADGKIYQAHGSNQPQYLYDYSYKVESTQFMFEGKLKWKIQKFLPYIMVGVGPAWLKVDDFSASSKIDESCNNWTTNPFGSKNEVNIAYQLGIGLDYQIARRDFIGASYRYMNLGDIDSEANNDANYKLNVGTIETNDVMLNYTHRF